MNPPKCDEYDYISFLTATPKASGCIEAGKVRPDRKNAPAHDSVSRLLLGLPANASSVREESSRFVNHGSGVLASDDSAPDKPYAQKTELVRQHWSGKHHRVAEGTNLVSLLRTDGDAHIPCDYRICYESGDGKTKNNHFSDMLSEAKIMGSDPEYVLSDTWHASPDNPGTIRNYGWYWLTRSEKNRLADPDGKGNIPLASAAISENGTIVRPGGVRICQDIRDCRQKRRHRILGNR